MDWCCNHGSGRRNVEGHRTHCRPAGLCAVCLVLRLEDQTGETGKQLVGASESSVGSSGCLSSQGPLMPLQWVIQVHLLPKGHSSEGLAFWPRGVYMFMTASATPM